MRATVFFISLFLALFGGKDLQASTVSHAHSYALAKSIEKDFGNTPLNIGVTKADLGNDGQFSKNALLDYDEIDDDDERNAFVKKYRERELAKQKAPHYAVLTLHFFYQAPKATALISAYTSPIYILQRTLRI